MITYQQAVEGRDEQSSCDGAQDEEEKDTEEFEDSQETNMYLGILEGFVMVLSTEGDMIFLSDNVSKYMGLTQVNKPTYILTILLNNQ